MRASSFLIRCPHCETRAVVRTSRQENKTLRFLTCQCTNAFCGYTFVASLEAIRTISPSAIPDAEVNLASTEFARTLQEKGELVRYEKPMKKMHPFAPDGDASKVTGIHIASSGDAPLQLQQVI